jgi:flagellar biogenesis protein FliO
MELARQVGAIVIVLGLLAVFAWLRARRGAVVLPFGRTPRGDYRLMETLDRISLSPSHVLHLVRVGDRSLLVAIHNGGCSLLDARPLAELEARTVQGAAR